MKINDYKNLKIFTFLFLVCCTSKSPSRLLKVDPDNPIIGTWMVQDAEILPLEIPSYCYKVPKHSRFIFNPDNSFKVFLPGKNKPCNKDQIFWIDSTDITVFEYDVGISFKVKQIQNDTLILLLDYAPLDILLENKTDSTAISKFIKNGILIKLSKVKNDE